MEITIFWLVQENEHGRSERDRRFHRRRHERGGLQAEEGEGWWRLMTSCFRSRLIERVLYGVFCFF